MDVDRVAVVADRRWLAPPVLLREAQVLARRIGERGPGLVDAVSFPRIAEPALERTARRVARGKAGLVERVAEPVLRQALGEVSGGRPATTGPGGPEHLLDLAAVGRPVLRVPDRPALALLEIHVTGRAANRARPAPARRRADRPVRSPGRPGKSLRGRDFHAAGCARTVKSGSQEMQFYGIFRDLLGTRNAWIAFRQKKNPGFPGLSYSGGGIRTRDLRVMSPTSYQTAPPRGGLLFIANRGRRTQGFAALSTCWRDRGLAAGHGHS